MTRLSVTDDQYGQLWRRLEEVARRVREGTLGFSETMTALQGVVEGTVQQTIASFQFDKTKDGWTLLEDVPFDPYDRQLLTPRIIGFLKSGESYVNSDIMRQRAKEASANLGQRHAEFYLNNQDLIPAECRGRYYLIFPGTVWQDRNGGRDVPFLYWNDDRWYLYFNWLGNDWSSRDHLVRGG